MFFYIYKGMSHEIFEFNLCKNRTTPLNRKSTGKIVIQYPPLEEMLQNWNLTEEISSLRKIGKYFNSCFH